MKSFPGGYKLAIKKMGDALSFEAAEKVFKLQTSIKKKPSKQPSKRRAQGL
jgi:hypothetical protein